MRPPPRPTRARPTATGPRSAWRRGWRGCPWCWAAPRVHAHARVEHLGRHGLRQRHRCALRRGVGRRARARRRFHGGARPDDDDAAPPRRHHARQERPERPMHGLQVGPHHASARNRPPCSRRSSWRRLPPRHVPATSAARRTSALRPELPLDARHRLRPRRRVRDVARRTTHSSAERRRTRALRGARFSARSLSTSTSLWPARARVRATSAPSAPAAPVTSATSVMGARA